MSIKPQKADDYQLQLLRNEAADLACFNRIYDSPDGKVFIKYLDKAMDETTTIEDKKDLSHLDRDARHDFLMSTRSKRQTLRAIRDLFINAKENQIEIMKEL